MTRHALLFGLIGGLLITLLKWSEYRFLVIDHSMQIYAALTAATFATLGIWLGVKLTAKRHAITIEQLPVPTTQPLVSGQTKPQDLGLTPREREVLELIAQGMSNREIAEKLYVSQNTIKTHSSRVFDKLGAKRRTQAVQLGKQLGLLP